MAYDAESDRVVLFGGCAAGTFFFCSLAKSGLGETWAYDFNANTWLKMNPSTEPSPRWGHAMAYDGESDRVILLSGFHGPETWAYDFNANTWANMSPAIQPIAWSFADMAYDAESDQVVLFGGCARGLAEECHPEGGIRDETWVYDYNANTWTNMNPGMSPSGREFHGMAYDAGSDRVVLFGGRTVFGLNLADTWAYNFNDNSWTEMNPPEAPRQRVGHDMAYDANADRIITFGGGATSDTWTYDLDGDSWTLKDGGTQPSPRTTARLAYDTESDRIVLFGGLTPVVGSLVGNDETWAHQVVPSPIPPPPLPPWLLIAIGVAATAVVAVVSIFLSRRRKSNARGRGMGIESPDLDDGWDSGLSIGRTRFHQKADPRLGLGACES